MTNVHFFQSRPVNNGIDETKQLLPDELIILNKIYKII